MIDTKLILKELENITWSKSRYTIFDDWLDLMLYAFQGDDENYLRIINAYDNRGRIGERASDHFANALGALMSLMQEANKEILGYIYMEWNISNKHSGQFFTPFSVAKMMAMLTGETGGLINDPACGSGIMLIAKATILTNEEIDKSLFVGQDLDLTCIKMTALNMMFFNLNGYAIHCDTLRNEYYAAYQTTRSYLGGSIRKLTEEELEIIKPKLDKIVKKENKPNLKQIGLFEEL